MHRVFHLIALSLLLAGLPPALAQEESRSGVTSFPPAYFQNNQPATALDMVALLPGFILQEGNSDLRGYSGAAGNVLIDGQRPASKEESVDDLLRRIPAGAVDHVELIRSGASGFDMQGFALLANVVRNRGSQFSGRIDAEHTRYRRGPSDWRLAGQLSWAGDDRTLDLAASLSRDMDDNGLGFRNRYAASGAPLRIADYSRFQGDDVQQLSADYTQGLLGGALRLGALFKNDRGFDSTEDAVRTPLPFDLLGDQRWRDRTMEARMEYERPLGATGKIQLLAVHRAIDETRNEQTIAPGQVDTTRQRSDGGETILRGVYRYQVGSLSLETGAEGARNVLDSHSALELNGVGIALPAANVKVEEDRAEFFAVGTWRLGAEFTTEAALRYEASTLTQSGDSNLVKPLSYLKPRLLTTWTPTPRNQLRFLAEREVGQLDFANFVSSSSLNSNSVTAGNENLEPDRTWRVELAWEQGLWDRSSLVLAARREFITGVIDHVPVFAGGQLFDAIGNIDTGVRDEFEATFTLGLDGIGLAGVTVQGDGTLRRSRVIDPATGAPRRISQDLPVEGEVSVTHDIPQWRLRWGVDVSPAEEEDEYKVDEFGRMHSSLQLNGFIEYKPSPEWVFRIVGRNLAQSATARFRTVYAGLRGSSPLSYDESRRLGSGANFGIRVQRVF